jgi:uncharacterized OsmC-like protein
MSESAVTRLKLLHGYKFKAEFDVEGMPELVLDELKPLGENSGPNPTRLLSAAIGHCLSSSLLYCLERSRVAVKNLETMIKTNVERNEEGRLRVKSLEVQLHIEVDEKDREKLSRCLDIFENYCTVTQAVRKGVEVIVNIR